MTAAVITTDETVAEAHAVLHMAVAAKEWPPEGAKAREVVCEAVVRLGIALVACQQRVGDAEAADEAAKAADELIRVMNEHCGQGWGGLR